ncbi:hypothetical protein MBLNU230_g7588t1 [Neophaeotheca triangularis]
MIDLEWLDDPEGELEMGRSPFHFAADMLEQDPKRERKSLYSHFSSFFTMISISILKLDRRFRVEAIAGEITAVLEHIRHGVVGHRQAEQNSGNGPQCNAELDHNKSGDGAQGRPSPASETEGQILKYPQLYDRIHLSNIPDYVGGTLFTFLYALPVTKPDKFSHFMPMAEYLRWTHTQKVPNTFGELLPRCRLETWLYRFFLKTAIPFPRTPADRQLIYSPLNLTVFFRLLGHLHNMGYLAHWLTEIVSTLLSGEITTTARPPRSEPLMIREVNTNFPSRKQSVAPFLAEMRTLASMWQPALAFGALLPAVPDPKTVREYQVPCRHVMEDCCGTPSFVLAFFKGSLLSALKYRIREQGLHIVTTWSYEQVTKVATFWLCEDVMRKMRGESMWAVGIWRTDTWGYQSPPTVIEEVRETGRTWA